MQVLGCFVSEQKAAQKFQSPFKDGPFLSWIVSNILPKEMPCKAYIVLFYLDLSSEKLSVDILKIHHYLILNCQMAYSCVAIRKCETDDMFIFGQWNVLLISIQILCITKKQLDWHPQDSM